MGEGGERTNDVKIGVVANLAKPATATVLERLSAAAEGLGVSFRATDAETAGRLGGEVVEGDGFAAGLDAVLSVGGDGTVLRAVRTLRGARIPVMGIHAGHVGFLTGASAEEAGVALQALATGQVQVTEHSLLEARLYRGGGRRAAGRWLAMNDVVLGWGEEPKAAMLELAVDGTLVASYVCDGLIVATPVGSTGHALSAGGPILHRGTRAVVIEPICPHTLSSRSLVLPDTCGITLRVAEGGREMMVSVDGQSGGWVGAGDRIEIRKARERALFAELPSHSWFRMLSQKLHWRGSSR